MESVGLKEKTSSLLLFSGPRTGLRFRKRGNTDVITNILFHEVKGKNNSVLYFLVFCVGERIIREV